MNILYLGSPTSYVTQNDLIVLTTTGYNVTLLTFAPIPNNPRTGLVEVENLVSLCDRTVSSLWNLIGGTLTSILLDVLNYKVGIIEKIIRDLKIDLIYATWGSNMIPLVKIIQRAKMKIPIIYNFLSYPQNVYRWKVFLENWYCRKPIERLDGRIHASQNMYQYMSKRFDLKKHGLDIIVTPFFSEKCHYRKRLPLLSEKDGEPHLVYIGPLTSSRNWDDIRQEIYEIANEKIHIHLAETDVPLRKSPYIHFFPYFPLSRLIDGSLATYMTQFDACIVLFNFKACSCLDRFYTSFPSRFLFALNAGIPIVMPKGYLHLCERFINEHQIGFTYRKTIELKEALSNFDLMQKYRRNAMTKSSDFKYEKEFRKIDKLMKALPC
jgi:glycosyltransferase involved in cell wall biosynthesis